MNSLSANRPEGGAMKEVAIAGIAVSLAAGLLASCGGGYGGGGSNPPASLSMSVTPDTITLGQSATITWNTNGNTCTASGDWSGTRPGSGSETVTPVATGTFMYELRCRGGGYGESTQQSATLAVNPAVASAAGLWIGDACCSDSVTFPVSGLTGSAGDFRFLMLGEHFVGEAGRAPVAYAGCDSCLAGARQRNADALMLLAVMPHTSAREAMLVRDAAGRQRRIEFTVPYDRGFERPSSFDALQGSYTTFLGSGYTLTITVDAGGEVTGADTNGCIVHGQAQIPRPAVNAYDVTLEVAACGTADGRYEGSAALVFDGAGRASGLFLSTSNEKAAIGWRLSR
jgi:hypothetical protein